MTYQQRLALFCYWADYYGLKLITPKYKHDDTDRSWAE